ncbi:unnamed protein product [Trichogramma brassicae]|uniref:Uncharacterized protein n=1 Tax=Trichogramma brassicae TaxID=86971 RepID=A0A6H5JBM0_9HYME|nr:unnamed protein product [Trichogramma brassicae]
MCESATLLHTTHISQRCLYVHLLAPIHRKAATVAAAAAAAENETPRAQTGMVGEGPELQQQQQ